MWQCSASPATWRALASSMEVVDGGVLKQGSRMYFGRARIVDAAVKLGDLDLALLPGEAVNDRGLFLDDLAVGALATAVPDPRCELDWKTPFELLIATILAAQCTDERVNQVTPALWRMAADPRAMATVPEERIREIIRPCGLSPQKAKRRTALPSPVSTTR